jgi:hypothetical protein
MRGCTCHGLTLCPWCQALAARAVGPAPGLEPGSGVAGRRGLDGGATPGIARPHLSERAFMQALRREALAGGWLFYHTFDSRRSAPGFFDCVCAKPGYPLVLSELKTATGIITIEQQRWHDTVRQATGVECYIWRPEDMERIHALLGRKLSET